MIDKHLQFVIASTPCSGIRYISKLFTKLGIPCGHENVFSCEQNRTIPNLIGDSSWMSVPFLNTLPQNVYILHQTRHPLPTIKVHPFMYKYFGNDKNEGIFEGTKRMWMYAYDSGYDFVLNLQDDFPCLRQVPFVDLSNYLYSRQDVGFILLNDKSKLVKKYSSGKESIKKKREFVKFNHHFTFNPTFVRTSILPGIMLNNPKPRERGIMERYNKLGMYASKTNKRFFETVIRVHNEGWSR